MESQRQVIQIDVLPHDVLLEIFYFYTEPLAHRKDRWQLLVHVCRQWRNLVFGSPRYLKLRLDCTPKTPIKDTLDVWPALPLIVHGNVRTTSGTENIVAALGHNNRVCKVDLWGLGDRKSDEVLASMLVPFPELTDLMLQSCDNTALIIPDSFLGGSASCLRSFSLNGIPFPELPKLILSAPNLVCLELLNIPHSGYISPEAIVDLLSVLSNLKRLWLWIVFQSPQSRPLHETRRFPLSKRFVIPALTSLHFKGVTEYLEDLVAGIDTPQLQTMSIHFFCQTDFVVPQLTQFINRTPKLIEREAHVQFAFYYARVALRPRLGLESAALASEMTISCKGECLSHLSSMAKVCNSSLHTLSTVEDLYIELICSKFASWRHASEDFEWLQLLLPFTAVKNLYLCKEFAPEIVTSVQGLFGHKIAEVLPSLQNIFVEGLVPSGHFFEGFGQFVAARRLSGHPVTISDWTGPS